MAQEKARTFSKKRKAEAVAPQLSKSGQKRALLKERQSTRKHAESVTEAKKIWNQLRQKNSSKEEIEKMTQQLMSLIKGKVHEIALQHDASRVVQAVLQFGSNQERKQVMDELCQASLVELAKNQYAHFVVLKSIKYCASNEECACMIVKAMKGSIPKLAMHATGSKVVEALFQTFPTKSTAVLQQEFYGPHFALFSSDVVHHRKQQSIPDLATHLQKSPDKKEHALSFIKQILNKGIEKSLFGYTFYQELFAEYIANCSPNDVRDIAPSVVDHSIHLLSSKAGTRVVAACAAYGTVKDRKRIMRSLKGFTRSALLHRDAYLAVLRLVQVVDDTVSIHKNIFNELLTAPETEEESDKPPLLEVALDDRACKLLLMLLVTNDDSWKKLFDPYERAIMAPNPTVVEKGQEVPTSKKNSNTRREELIQPLQKPLIKVCTDHTQELLFSLPGSALLREVYNAYHPESLVKAIVDVCETELSDDNRSGDETDNNRLEESEALPLFEDRVGHLAIKNLILCDVEGNREQNGVSFSAEFLDRLGDRLPDVAKSNRGAFVLAALCKVPAVTDETLRKLQKETKKLQKMADEGKSSAGYQALLKELEQQ